LANLYNETGQTDETKNKALKLLAMPVKVESIAIEEIKLGIKNILLNPKDSTTKNKRERRHPSMAQ